jgi:hypothetical protein
MSTLQVDTINSFTTVNPVEINDNFRVTGSSTFTGSIDIKAPHKITGASASFHAISVTPTDTYNTTPGTISGSGFNIASKITANSGSFIGGVIVGIANDNTPLAGGVAVGASGISSSGDILGGTVQCKNGFEHIGNSSIADGAKAGPLKVKSNKISVDSAVMASIVGPVSGGALSNSISASILSTFVENNTCSIYLYNETGQTLEDNTTFTCSLMVIQ